MDLKTFKERIQKEVQGMIEIVYIILENRSLLEKEMLKIPQVEIKRNKERVIGKKGRGIPCYPFTFSQCLCYIL